MLESGLSLARQKPRHLSVKNAQIIKMVHQDRVDHGEASRMGSASDCSPSWKILSTGVSTNPVAQKEVHMIKFDTYIQFLIDLSNDNQFLHRCCLDAVEYWLDYFVHQKLNWNRVD